MDIQDIVSLICLIFLCVNLMGLLWVALAFSYKSEKEYKELRNKELKARIKFFDKYNKDNNERK